MIVAVLVMSPYELVASMSLSARTIAQLFASVNKAEMKQDAIWISSKLSQTPSSE